MKITLHLYIYDTDGGTGAQVYTSKQDALDALWDGLTRHGYKGDADERKMSDWKDANDTGLDTMFVETQEVDISEILRGEKAFC